MLMFSGGVSLMLCFITNQKGAESSKILNLLIHAPLLLRDDVRWYFPGLCGVPETTMWHSGQVSVTTSVMFYYSWRVMIVLRWSVYIVVSDSHVLGLFFPLPRAVLIGFTQEGNILLQAAVGRIVFLSVVFIEFNSRYQSTLIPVPPSIRTLWIQGISPHALFPGSNCWILPRTIHPLRNRRRQ